jgi:hypothetical protein
VPLERPSARADLTVLESLFDSDAMVIVGRLLIVAAALVMLVSALFVLASIAVRARRGDWLKRAGPFEVSDTVAGEVGHSIQTLERTVEVQRDRIAELEVLLSSADELVATDDREDS